MKSVFRITLYVVLAVLAISCSDDENPADNFLGTQDVTITVNDQAYALKGGAYYDEQDESNCDINEIVHFGDSSTFRFGLNNGVGIDIFNFTFDTDFNSNGVAVGQIVTNPYFFSFTMRFENQVSFYRGGVINGQDAYFGNGSSNEVVVSIQNVSMVVNERVSNGREQVIDGVRQDYPLEKVSGALNFSFTDESGNSQDVSMDFNLEGENIVIEPDEFISSDTSDDDGNGGGSGTDCGNLEYNGPTEGQIAQFCQTAQLAQCTGNTTEYNLLCDIIADYEATCPYCN
jgi:hypothetical protein